MTLPPRALGARVRDPHVQWMGQDCVLLLGDVGARAVYLVETPTSFGRGAESPQTLNYAGDAGQC